MEVSADPPSELERHICCSLTSVLVRLVRAEGGEAAVAALLKDAGVGHDAAFLEGIENWISLGEAVSLLEAGVRVTGDPRFARRVGEQAVRQHAGSPVATLLRSLGSPEALLTAIAATAAKFSTVTEMQAVEVGAGRAVVRAVARDGFTRQPLLCDWTLGLLSTPTVLFGLPPARVHETECQARGGARCEYTVTWDAELAAAAADPEQRVTALEGQLVALSQRLQAVYATVTDLVSPDDLETVLARIVERAANEIRATGYVLAVHPKPDSGLQIFWHGLTAPEARALAESDPAAHHDRHSLLTADVVSSRRRYGRLMAVYPAGVEYFDQEQQALSLYAKHAAAVLDMATALQDSARRHAQVSALLALAHELARAGTSAEVAERLAGAVPKVIDCDAVATWLWDPNERLLRLAGTSRTEADGGDLLRATTIRTEDTPQLARMLTAPEPVFLDASTEDPFLRKLMSELDIVALAMVPIRAHDEFVGVLSVSALDRPERLQRDAELVERLTGVAAITATTLQNGHLVDELDHRAAHDDLTGTLNRAGFGQHMSSILGGRDGSEERVGLLFIDLDDFKQVNDLHGHDVGDALLRETAGRLISLFRRDDYVARLGGDEFAVILSGVGGEDEVAAAARRARACFEEPFKVGRLMLTVRASVGHSIWPDGGRTVEALIKQADARMYHEKAAVRLAASASPDG